MDIVSNLISWGSLVGFVLGFITSRVWQVVKVCRLDKARPLPDGRHRPKCWQAIAIDPRYAAGAIAVVFLVWSVVQTQANADENKALSARTQACQARLITAITDSRKVTATNERISAENDELPKEVRELLADLARYQSEWLGRILDPPAEVKVLERGSPVRERYNLDVTRGFFNRAGEIIRRIDTIRAEQDQNERDRPTSRPALPDPSCAD